MSLGPSSRLMRVRNRPSARCGSSAASRASRQRVAGDGIADDADHVAAPRLLGAEIADMPEQAADRRAQAVQDAICARLCGRPARRRSEPALVDVDRVAGQNDVVRWYIHLL